MKALICGSLAYDTIMVFHDRFKNHILPDKVHMLNVSFTASRLDSSGTTRRSFVSSIQAPRGKRAKVETANGR